MEEYINTIIKTRGYSPLEKIKETYEIDNIIYPMPQTINIQSSDYKTIILQFKNN